MESIAESPGGLGGPEIGNPAPDRRSAADLKVGDMANLLLLLLARRGGFAFVVTPGDMHYTVTVATRDTQWLAAVLPPRPGQALVVRLAAMAGLDLAQAEQVGCIRVHAGGRDRELMIVARHDREGLAAEVRRVADIDDAAVPRPIAGLSSEVSQKLARRVGGYRLLRELGRGAMGIVYLGEHETLRKHVAIKVMSDRLLGQPEACARFLREARAASSVRHPGLVDVTDFGILPDGRPFLAMELCDMPTLESQVFEGALEPTRAIRIAIQMANAIAAAHARGVVHRDLKPANVFLGPGDTVKIGDFGAAKIVGGEPVARGPNGEAKASQVLGTPLYMPPEQAQGVSVDRRADVYALGCILYEMVSGHPPFEDETPREVILMHITEPVPPLESPLGALPRGLEALVRRAMAKNPAKRIPSAEQLAHELEALIMNASEPAAVPTMSRWRKWFSS